MNSTPAPESHPAFVPPAAPHAPDAPHAPPAPPAPRSTSPTPVSPSRRTGKIASLPKKLRALINSSLDEGATYSQIVQLLTQSTDPPLPYPISERNLSDWHHGGFQDWLRHQEHLQLLGAKIDFALDLARHTQPDKLQELSLQLAALRICEFLSDLAVAGPDTDPNTYLRLLSIIPRLSKETLNLQKFRAAAAPSPPVPGNPATDQERLESARSALMEQLDTLLGLHSYRLRTSVPSSIEPPLHPVHPVHPSPSLPHEPPVPPESAPLSSASPEPAPSSFGTPTPEQAFSALPIAPEQTETAPPPATEGYGNPRKVEIFPPPPDAPDPPPCSRPLSDSEPHVPPFTPGAPANDAFTPHSAFSLVP